MKKTFSAKPENIRVICLEAGRLFKDWNIPEIDAGDIVLSLDEALTNIITHGYSYRDVQEGRISVEVFKNKSKVNVILKDNANAYSIENIHPPDAFTYLESGIIGGFGVSIIKKLMSSVKLLRMDGQNILWMCKEISPFDAVHQDIYPETIETKTADAYVEDGILKIITKPGSSIALQDAVEQIEAYIRLIEHYPEKKANSMVINTKGMKRITKKARDYYIERPDMGICVIAIVIDSIFARWLANIFISMNKRDIEIKMFNNESSALQWVRQLWIRQMMTNM